MLFFRVEHTNIFFSCFLVRECIEKHRVNQVYGTLFFSNTSDKLLKSLSLTLGVFRNNIL